MLIPRMAAIKADNMPITDAPMPAWFPNGSMAMAITLPKINPTQMLIKPINAINTAKGGTPPYQLTAFYVFLNNVCHYMYERLIPNG